MRKQTNKILGFILLMVASLSIPVFAGGEHKMPPPFVGSADFQKIKGLAGTWKGDHIEQDGTKTEMTVEYQVTSNGSAVVEKLSPGSPHEMISVYREKAGKLSMTHYCAIGNQPELDLVSSGPDKMEFDFSPDNKAINPATENHMHALTLRFEGDKLIQNWKYFEGGKEAGNTEIVLSRAS